MAEVSWVNTTGSTTSPCTGSSGWTCSKPGTYKHASSSSSDVVLSCRCTAGRLIAGEDHNIHVIACSKCDANTQLLYAVRCQMQASLVIDSNSLTAYVSFSTVKLQCQIASRHDHVQCMLNILFKQDPELCALNNASRVNRSGLLQLRSQ